MKERRNQSVVLVACALAAVLVLTHATTILGDAPPSEVTICHIPPGNPGNAHTITIPESALAAHLAHGDTIGACDDSYYYPVRGDGYMFGPQRPEIAIPALFMLLGFFTLAVFARLRS